MECSPCASRLASLVLPLSLSAIVLTGCNGGRPSPKEAEQALRNSIDEGRQARLQLVSFRKVDGQSAELMGVKIYNYMFAAEAEFVANASFSATSQCAPAAISV